MNIFDRILLPVTSFRSKQQRIIMLACIIVLSVSFGSSLIYEAFSFNRDSRARLEVLADIVAADISAALAFDDTAAIDKTLKTMAVDQSIIQLFVLNAQGDVVGWYVRDGGKLTSNELAQRLLHIRQETARKIIELSPEVVRPVRFEGEYLGDVLVELDSQVFIRKMMVSGSIGTGILLLALLGSYLLARRLGQCVTEPIQSLAATMEEVSRTKNYHLRADVHGLTELTLLSKGFNEMLGEIALRDEAILESEYRWKFAIEGAGDGVWDWNILTDEAKYSRRWKEMLGYAEDEILPENQEWADRIHPDDRAYVAGAMQAYLDGRTETYVVEYRLRCKDGGYKWILGRGMVVSRDEDGRPLRMIGTHTDITERKRAEEELRQKNADIEQFLYTVSHDLRTPLVTVKSFLGFLENDMREENQQRISQDLQFIHGAADKMKRLLDELLELSRVDRVESNMVAVSFKDVVNEVLDIMAGVFSEQKVEIQHRDDSNVMMYGDRPRFCQIWQNLIENAVKYSYEQESPRVEVGIRDVGSEPVFYVKDNGIGIDPDYHEKIFNLFEKLDPGSSGVGIGLAMVRRIVEKFGGRIWVESEGKGTGSCFCFTLPGVVLDRERADAIRVDWHEAQA